MDIVVDDREVRSGVPEYLRRIAGTTVTIGRLPLGDYLVDNRLLFERKTVHDFAMSLLDGRLFDQACRLSGSSHLPIYILEGSISDIKALSIRREAMQGALISITIIFGIPLLRSFNRAETARLMFYAAKQARRIAIGNIKRVGYQPKGRRKRQLHILQGLPGVGPVRAEELLKVFGSLNAVFSATPAELKCVAGLGAKTAKKISEIVN